ncbi:MAG TPA: NADH-quinone oxidoreductase subunit N, partial [Polyangiaceae bacterium]|nr:NADH-quinone oxidoreductase subunit N [Polyangiaceae bacterium]
MMDSVFVALAPILVVSLGGLLLMLTEVLAKRRTDTSGPSSDLALGSFIALMAGAVVALALWFVGPDKLGGAKLAAPYLVVDRFTLFFDFVLCLGGGLTCLLAGGYLPEHKLDRGEFYPLIIFSTVGAMILAAAGDLLSLFIGLETMSLGVYAMVG